MFAKALITRLAAVLISGTLGLAPFSCCCASMESAQIEALANGHAQDANGHAQEAMAGMEHMGHGDHRSAQTAPADDQPCPHKLTANLDTAKAPAASAMVHAPVPVVYHATPANGGLRTPVRTEWSLRIKPPPLPHPTLVSQHILLLA